MSRYPVYATDGIEIREKGPKQVDPVVETITAEDLLRLKRLADREANRERAETKDPEQFAEAVDALVCFARNQTEAATPEPGGLDVETELAIYQTFMQRAFETPEKPLSPAAERGFRDYLRDLESRRKPAEPSGWPEVVTIEDTNHIRRRTSEIYENARYEDYAAAMRQALQEWIDSKPRPKPVAGTPESVELTEEQALRVFHAGAFNPGAKKPVGMNAALREMGLGLHRLDPKPSAEPDADESDRLHREAFEAADPSPREDDGGNPDMIEALFVEFGMFQASLKTVQSYVSAIDRKLDTDGRRLDDIQKHVGSLDAHVLETKHGVGMIGKRLDAIAERLDGPKVEAVTLTNDQADYLYTHLANASPLNPAAIINRQFDEWGLILIRKPLTNGDPS